MKILVTYGSKLGGTAGIADQLSAALRAAGHQVDVRNPREVGSLDGYTAVIVGGALYAARWHHDARDFVLRHARELRGRRVWFFSSGPLDDSASHREIAPTPQVQELIDYVSADGHVTFGGRLEPDAKSFPASAMAKTHSGDWRDPSRIEGWARAIAAELSSGAFDPSHAKRPHRPLPSRNPVLALCLLTGINAIAGGVILAARPDGSLAGMPLSVLEHSPFQSFLVPGLLLLVVVGLGNLAAAWLHARRSDGAPFASFVSGGALTVWIIVQMIMLRGVNALQAVCFVVGIATMGDSLRRLRRMMAAMPAPPVRPESPQPATAG